MNSREQNVLELLRSQDFPQILAHIDCGTFSDLQCLCSEYVREVHLQLLRLPIVRRELILRRLCGVCHTQGEQAAMTGQDEVTHVVGTSLDLQSVLRYVGLPSTQLSDLKTQIATIVQPATTSLKGIQWCGIVAAYVLAQNGYAVHWQTSKGIRYNDGRTPKTMMGAVQPGDYIVQPSEPWHYILIAGTANDGSVELLEGNTPGLKHYTLSAAEYPKYRTWLHYRPEK